MILDTFFPPSSSNRNRVAFQRGGSGWFDKGKASMLGSTGRCMKCIRKLSSRIEKGMLLSKNAKSLSLSGISLMIYRGFEDFNGRPGYLNSAIQHEQTI